MKMSQMIIQGVETKASPLLQLPHIRHDMLRHFVVILLLFQLMLRCLVLRRWRTV